MTTRHLDTLFAPKSVALIGASSKAGSVGKTIADNLLAGGFEGDIWFVTPTHKKVAGQPCVPSVQQLPAAPELAIIATPPQVVPGLVAELSQLGTKACVVITAGLREQQLTQQMLEASRPHCLRIVGPNCLGLMVPPVGLNASFAHRAPLSGDLAFLSQSGAIIGAVLDWASEREIGFSAMVSMGDMADADLGDMLDYFAADEGTRAILMYVEQVTDARKFMSAARSAARVKPVVLIKSGRHAAAAKAAHSHTGALAGSDTVYNAAFRRAGILRVLDLEDLFDAAAILSRLQQLDGDRLGILTNGGGAGVLAVDRLVDFGGDLAALSPETVARLDKVLPATWSHGNPVDIIGDAGPERYQQALEIMLAAPELDALLVMNCPTALASSTAAAKAVLATLEEKQEKPTQPTKPVLASWLGDGVAHQSRALFAEAGYPSYETPADAIRGFSYLTRYAKEQRALLQVPPNQPQDFKTKPDAARAVIQQALAEKREILTEPEAKAVLAAYAIPTVETVVAKTPAAVEQAAKTLLAGAETTIAVKIMSKDITHKSDAGGVVLGLPTAAAAGQAAQEMQTRIQAQLPDAVLEGFTVEPMIRRPGAHELIVGAHEDETFGPVILFGAGGTAVEVIKDTATALPPLDMNLAYDLMDETQVYKLLQGYRNTPAADMDAIALTLVKISQLLAELPEVVGLDINPLLADEKGVLALDARILVRPTTVKPGTLNPRFAIRPYPQQWVREATLPSGQRVLIRPVLPADGQHYDAFTAHTSAAQIQQSLFVEPAQLSRDFVNRLTQIDYARSMVFVALDAATETLLGFARLRSDAAYEQAEYALITRGDKQGQGIGYALLAQLVAYAKAEGIQTLSGKVPTENAPMRHLCQELGFHEQPSAANDVDSAGDAALLCVTLTL